jgi:hypothetical protein
MGPVSKSTPKTAKSSRSATTSPPSRFRPRSVGGLFLCSFDLVEEIVRVVYVVNRPLSLDLDQT